jgi:tRNA pseudouridine-54 N-methylase
MMSDTPTAQELLNLSLELSKMHLARLREKSRSQEGLSPHEGNCIGQYVKTFSAITKMEKEDERENTKSVAKMTDEELQKELAKLAKTFARSEDSDEI